LRAPYTNEERRMPLLPLEPFVLPEDLLLHPAPPLDSPRRWWVLHTKPRAEKSLARRLFSKHVPFFLPLYHHQWRSRGRLRSSYLPLFPGYLFLHGDLQDRLHTLATNLVARAIPVEDQRQLYADLVRVHQLVVTGAPLTAEARLEPGSPVEIIDGPFTGIHGKVLRRGNQLKLFVEVQFLQRGVSVEIENWMVRPLDGAKVASV
jgi:transcriptional antiterminator RfaH